MLSNFRDSSLWSSLLKWSASLYIKVIVLSCVIRFRKQTLRVSHFNLSRLFVDLNAMHTKIIRKFAYYLTLFPSRFFFFFLIPSKGTKCHICSLPQNKMQKTTYQFFKLFSFQTNNVSPHFLHIRQNDQISLMNFFVRFKL